MRTGNDVVKRVFILLGYIGNGGLTDLTAIQNNRLYEPACNAVLQIYSDLAADDLIGKAELPLEDMNQIIPLSYKTINDIMPYGVAMLVCAAAGEDSLLQFYTDAYNRKRAYIQKSTIRRRDVMPKVKSKDGWSL